MTNKKFNVVAAIVDKTRLTLYNDKGVIYKIEQGDRRLEPILEEILPSINAGRPIEIDLNESNSYREMEEASGGIVKFFRVARASIANLFGEKEPEEEIDPKYQGNHTVFESKGSISDEDMRAAIANINANVEYTDYDTLNADNLPEDETIVAVTNGRVVPDMEKLISIINHNSGNKDFVGTTKLIQRLSNVISDRQHSVKDALTFIAKSDLEIALDGSIIGYKVLKIHSWSKVRTFVDCHTRNVKQHVGSRVFMADKLVDPDRRNECSNGLHVARRGYLSSFTGDVCVMVRVNPENIIAVPQYDANKVRVSAYEILCELPKEAYALLKQNKPITTIPKCADLLTRAITGNFPSIRHTVEICGQQGSQLKHNYISKELREAVVVPAEAKNRPPAQAIPDKAEAIKAASVDPINVSKKVMETKGQKAPTNKDKIAALLQKLLYDDGSVETKFKIASSMMEIKKKAKVSWIKLGITDESLRMIQKYMAGQTAPKAANEKPSSPVTKAVASKSKAKPKTQKKQPAVTKKKVLKESKSKVTASPKAKTVDVTKLSNKEKAQYYSSRNMNEELIALKRKCKMSWEKLGVPAPKS